MNYDPNAQPPQSQWQPPQQPGQPWQPQPDPWQPTQGPSQPWQLQQPPYMQQPWQTQPGQWQVPQQQWPPQPQPQEPFQPQPPKKIRRLWLWIVGAVVVLGLCSALSNGLAHTSGNTGSTLQTSSTQVATPTSTSASTKHAVQSSSVPMTPVAGPLTLGQPLSHFLARYGTPMPASPMKDGSFMWLGGAMTVFAWKENKYLVNTVLYANDDGNGWHDQEKAVTACRVFLPGDAKYTRSVTTNAGFERVYLSPSLAPLFDHNQFTDENGNNATPGTIAIMYHLDIADATHITDCSVQVGLEGK